VNIAFAVLHQAGAVLLLTILIVVRHRATASPPRPQSAMVGG
jgi:heme a synthase